MPQLQAREPEVPQLQAREVPQPHRCFLIVRASCPPCDKTRCRPRRLFKAMLQMASILTLMWKLLILSVDILFEKLEADLGDALGVHESD